MLYQGTIHNGVVVFDGNIELPDGTPVSVVPLAGKSTTPPVSSQPDPLFNMSELAVETGIPDLAQNADHYFYGHPKTNGK